tara:strand:+ start:267 stop:584 length:318 start_codon:yes stop_codon:yes gene_type:complete
MSNKITYTKNDLINLVSKSLDIPKDKVKIIVEVVLSNMNDIFMKNQSHTRLEIRNFGVFEVKKTMPKPKARNPKTNEVIYVPSRRKIVFKPGKELSLKLKKEWDE